MSREELTDAEWIAKSIAGAILEAGDKIVEAINMRSLTDTRIVASGVELISSLKPDERIEIARQVLEGTSAKVAPR